MMFKDKDKVERYDFRVNDLPRDMVSQFLYTNLSNVLMNRSVGQLEPKIVIGHGMKFFIPNYGLSNEWLNKIDKQEHPRDPYQGKDTKNI